MRLGVKLRHICHLGRKHHRSVLNHQEHFNAWKNRHRIHHKVTFVLEEKALYATTPLSSDPMYSTRRRNCRKLERVPSCERSTLDDILIMYILLSPLMLSHQICFKSWATIYNHIILVTVHIFNFWFTVGYTPNFFSYIILQPAVNC